jgi:parallel beta-helix repeat protein
LRWPSRSRGVVLSITAVIVCPTLAVTSGAGTGSVAVSRDQARGIALAIPWLEEPPKGAPPTTPTATPAPTAPPTSKPAPPRVARPRQVPAVAPPRCTGPPLTSESQVQPNTSYCRGHATSRIVLADGDTWTNGEVSGVSTGRQEGAVQCGDPCTLVNMNVHDNPDAFAGIYMPGSGAGPVTVSGGRVSGNGSLGIGGSGVDHLTISGVEIDHNGASADCGLEGGGFKGVNNGSRFTSNYVHDNNCFGVWYDINAANNHIDHNRVDRNSEGGIFYEISQDAAIYDNEVSGNGHSSVCNWLWGAGIGIASSFNIQVYGNTVTGNCNGIAGTQQDRNDSTPPDHLLANLSIHNNRIAGPGKTGVAADNGADLATQSIAFTNNSFSGGATLCALSC